MSESLQSFTSWAKAKGVVANPNGSYAGQCVSLVQQYLYRCYDVPYRARGNAKDFVPPKFHKVSGNYQAGDILRYGANYGGGYGHIGLIDEIGWWLDQNGVKRRAVGTSRYPFSGWNAVYRPDSPVRATDSASKASNGTNWNTKGIPAGATPQSATFRATTTRNIRRAPGLSGEIARTLDAGATVRYDCYVDADNFRWVSYVGYSGKRCYVAVRRLSDNKRYGACY